MKTLSLSRYALSAAATFAAMAAVAQNNDFSSVEIKVHQVKDNIYYLEGRGGNVGVSVGDDGVLMIDDQFAPLTDKILAAIATISDGDVRFVINTHVHPDHVGGNENLGGLGIPIIAHDKVRLRLVQGIRGGPPAPADALPILTYADGISLDLNGDVIQVLKMPAAHTDGDSIIYFHNADVMHLGDIFRTTGYPVIDVDNGGSARGTLDALALVLDMAGPETQLIPGHGEVSGREDVQVFRDMIADVTQRVSQMVKQGMTLEQVMAAKPTAAYDEKWGSPDRFLQGLYASLKATM
jgi:cyclase